MNTQPRYDTWIRKRKIVLFWSLTALLASTALLGLVQPLLALAAVTAIPFAYIAVVISLSAYRFSPRGGDYQNQIHALLVDAVNKTGTVLDVGCGSGNLIIRIARKLPESTCIGVDMWGDEWEYSKRQCEANAAAEGVDRIRFIRASASALPLEDNSVDAVVSCLTFHEVLDQEDKSVAIGEAIRVLRPGGTFALFDLFDDDRVFGASGGVDRVTNAITTFGGSIALRRPLSEMMRLPFPLNTAKALRYGVLITGTRS